MPNYSEAHLETLRRLFAHWPEVSEGRMFGYPAFYVGRKMFACVYGAGVALKLPASMVPPLLARPTVKWFEPMGRRRMREWIEIDRVRSADYRHDRALFEAAIRYAAAAAPVEGQR
ncbi:MAG: TfoX/Sxy family protein [Betaproteobacteria bacterium]|jgi:hypothetical protein